MIWAVTALALMAVTAIAWAWLRRKPDPAELEKRRRDFLNASGKQGDAMLVDAGEGSLLYSYSVHGMEYTATQEVTALEGCVPAEPWKHIGPVMVKYDAKNPANSILVCEEWSGLRKSLHKENQGK